MGWGAAPSGAQELCLLEICSHVLLPIKATLILFEKNVRPGAVAPMIPATQEAEV